MSGFAIDAWPLSGNKCLKCLTCIKMGVIPFSFKSSKAPMYVDELQQ